jgi:hypothetical protein
MFTMRPLEKPEQAEQPRIDLATFSARLNNLELNPAQVVARHPTQDMTRPLSHYFIYSR